jgi:20S proteasome subunit beta 5
MLSLDFMQHNRYSSVGASNKALESGADLKELMSPTTFSLPRSIQLQTNTAENFCSPLNSDIKFAHGTTTLAFIFNGGILMAVDSRASMGSYIGSNSVRKVVTLSDYMLGTIAGGAADCSFWQRNLSLQCRMWQLREGRRITTAAASKLLTNNAYQYRGRGLSMGIMIGGYDEKLGASLYYIDDDGTRLKGNLFSVGSGGTYAYGVVDREYRPDLTEDEAIELGKRAIFHATHRDAYSGGIINVFVITKNGWTQKWRGDMNTIYYGPYLAEKSSQAAANAQKEAGKPMDVVE